MDAHLFRRFCGACVPLLEGARLAKIQEPADGVLTLNLDLFASRPGFGRKAQLVFRPGHKDPFMFLSPARVAAGRTPSAPVMRLRKYAAGHTIRRAVSRWVERELWLLVSGAIPAGMFGGSVPAEEKVPAAEGDGAKLVWLKLSLREGASLCFLGADGAPLSSEPAWPSRETLGEALADWNKWPVLTPALRRAMKGMDGGDRAALLVDLEDGGGDIFLYSRPGAQGAPGTVEKVSCWPLQPDRVKGLTESVEPDVLGALARAGADLVLAEAERRQATRAAQPLNRREKKLVRLLEKQDEEEERLGRMRAGKEDALLLQGSLWQWPQDFRAPEVQVWGRDGKQRTIVLDKRWTVRENMERLFHSARRGERGLAHVAERRRQLADELSALRRRRDEILLGMVAGPGNNQDVPAPAKLPEVPKHVQLFVSSDGYPLLRGRDARGNLAVRKLAAQHDIWVHAAGGPGSHVIIRLRHAGEQVPGRTLDEAGSLAACKSWLRGEERGLVTYCEVRHVKPMRGAAPGTMRMDKVLFTREVNVDASLEESLLPGGTVSGQS